nr:ribonuclease H-like domain-containing protein [Tanacetum cinerariifolium]
MKSFCKSFYEQNSNGREQALSISKMKAARYLDFGLELLVPEDTWINEHKILLSLRVRLLEKITLRRADYQEYIIAEKDFKSLYPSDFEDLNLLLLQGHLSHLSGSEKRMLSTSVKLWTRNLVIRQRVEDFQLGIESYQKQLNLTKPGWDAKCFEYKHDYTIIDSPCVIVFPIGNNKWKIMRFNEIYKFSDGTLTNIMEALDFKVKEYKRKYVLDLLSGYGMLACKPAKTFLMSKLVISNEASENDHLLENVTDYQKMMGKLIYLTNTRPYISSDVYCLSQFMHSLLSSHLKIAFKILRYLKSCPGLGIHIARTSGMFFNAYSDADWVKCIVTRKYVTGYCVFLNNSLVSCKSKKQNTLSKSSTEAEYRALALVTIEVIWILNFLKICK